MPQKKSKSQKKRFINFAVITVALAIAVGGGITWYFYQQQPQTNETTVTMSSSIVQARKDRIEAIYASLKLGPEYQLIREDVFGDKRLYSWDKGRSYSSEKDYVRNAAVDATATELRKQIETAGYTYFEEPYPGSTFREYHFKSAKNEYIRMNVSSKPRDDAIRNHSSFDKLDPNAGPSSIFIKVNLDDNNE